MVTSTDIVPIGVIGSQFLEGTGLDKIDPLGNFELTGTLEVSSISLDESYQKKYKSLLIFKTHAVC
jgi:hypothetical protein